MAPVSVVLALLSAQGAQAAPAGLVSSITTAALLKQSGTSTLILVKGTLKVMAQAQVKKLALAAGIVLLGGTAAIVVPQSIQKDGPSGHGPAGEPKDAF